MVSIVPLRSSRKITGVIILITALAMAAFSGALMKLLSDAMSPFLIAWFRFTGSLLILVPITVIRFKRSVFNSKLLFLQMSRGIILVISNILFIKGVQEIDYANAIAILYVYPFFMMVLAPLVLGEKGSLAAWLGVFGGFAGVLFVMRPDVGSFNFNSLFILLAGLMVAIQMLLNRLLGGKIDPFVISTWGSLVAFFVLLPTVPIVWIIPTNYQIGIIVLMAIVTSLSQTMMISAMIRAPVILMAPFTYTEIIFAVLLGFLMFGSLPGFLQIFGIVLIICSGILVESFRNRKQDNRRNQTF